MRAETDSKPRIVDVIVPSVLVIVWLVSFLSPGRAIRSCIFLKLQPINSLILKSRKMSWKCR